MLGIGGGGSLPLHPEGPGLGEGPRWVSWDGQSGVVLGALAISC